jgi:hypothetical protein
MAYFLGKKSRHSGLSFACVFLGFLGKPRRQVAVISGKSRRLILWLESRDLCPWRSTTRAVHQGSALLFISWCGSVQCRSWSGHWAECSYNSCAPLHRAQVLNAASKGQSY